MLRFGWLLLLGGLIGVAHAVLSRGGNVFRLRVIVVVGGPLADRTYARGG